MTAKKLAPERLAEHRAALDRATMDFDSNDWVRRELLGHIEAIEAEHGAEIEARLAVERVASNYEAELHKMRAKLAVAQQECRWLTAQLEGRAK